VGCTVLQAGPCVVVQIAPSRRTAMKQRNWVGGIRQAQRVNKAMTGHFKRQICSDEGAARSRSSNPKKGTRRTNQGWRPGAGGNFKAGELVDVSGVSKARICRRREALALRGGDATHGSMFHRAPGGIGGSSFPSRVWKNQHFPVTWQCQCDRKELK